MQLGASHTAGHQLAHLDQFPSVLIDFLVELTILIDDKMLQARLVADGESVFTGTLTGTYQPTTLLAKITFCLKAAASVLLV